MRKKKYPNSESLKSVRNQPTEYYTTWSDTDASRQKAMATLSQAVEGYTSVDRTIGNHFTDFSNLATNVSGRPSLSREDYEAFRPNEAIATRHKDILMQANSVYYNVGLIRNIIDLMGDFACQGVHLVHPNKRIEKFYQDWFSKINGKERSERFLNYLYRLGNVVIRKQTARLKNRDKKFNFKTLAQPELKTEKLNINANEIPLKYTFIEPSVVDVVGGPLSSFIGKKQYAVTLPRSLKRAFQSRLKTDDDALLEKLPADIRAAVEHNRPVLLDPNKTSVHHYKKDDWQEWALPMIHAIMSDIIVLEKMKLADLAALDGAISNVRIFTLGDLEHKIAPSEAAASKLAEILENHTGVGTIDIVWGPDIKMQESRTTVHEFLGEGKYAPTLNAIYAGIGIPPTLTGTFGATGTTNNFISLKTLIKRLTYGRMILANFWKEEIKAVQLAMGFRFPARVEFDHMNLGDEEAEKALWVQMSDRNLISDELFQRKWGHDSEMENIRIKREDKEREDGRRVDKAGPYHDPQIEEGYTKTFVQTGVVAPSEVGVDLKPKKKGQKNAIELKNAGMNKAGPPGGKKLPGTPGRPKNSRDTKKRKEKSFTPKIKAAEVWAKEAQDEISDLLNEDILAFFNKKTMRSLTAAEHDYAEGMKFNVLCYLTPFSDITEYTVGKALEIDNISDEMYKEYKATLNAVSGDLNRALTLNEKKFIQASLYTEWRV